jgi:hypothetical protein
LFPLALICYAASHMFSLEMPVAPPAEAIDSEEHHPVQPEPEWRSKEKERPADLERRFHQKLAEYRRILPLTPREMQYKDKRSELLHNRIQLQVDKIFRARDGDKKLPPAESLDLFALLSVVEEIRKPKQFTASWEQALTALQIVHPTEHTIQKIQMRTGEGKTFVITMAAIWSAKHDRVVQIHTDKQVNVEEALREYSGLYRILDVAVGKYEKSHLRKEHTLAVRYGVWSDFGHEHLLRRNEIERVTYELEKIKKNAVTLTPEQTATAEELEKYLNFLKASQRVHKAIVDEGDKIAFKGESTMIISTESEVPYSDEEKMEFSLVDKLLLKDPPKDFAPKMGQLLFDDKEKGRTLYSISAAPHIIGQDKPKDTITPVANYVEADSQNLFLRTRAALTENAQLLSSVLPYITETNFQAGEESFVFSPEAKQRVLQYLKGVSHMREARGTPPLLELEDWQEIAQRFGPIPRKVLFHYILSEPQVFPLKTEVIAQLKRSALQQPNTPLSEREWQSVEAALPNAQVRLTMLLMGRVVDQKWSDLFTEFVVEALKVRYAMKENSDYTVERDKKGQKKVVILTQGKEPGVGKQYSRPTKELMALYLDMPLPPPDETLDEMTPDYFYEMLLDQEPEYDDGIETEVTALSGTMKNPDFVAQSEGKGVREWLPIRTFSSREHKLHAVVRHIETFSDKPILLCVRDPRELQYFTDKLAKGHQALKVLTARNTDEAGTLIRDAKPGTIVLLQLTARGLNLGSNHSFKHAHVIISEYNQDADEDIQAGGRVGDKRDSGKVVKFTSFEDEVAQKRFDARPDLAEKFNNKAEALDEKYVQVRERIEAIVTRHLPEAATWNWEWPETLGELVAEVQLMSERARDPAPAGSQAQSQREQPLPLWRNLFNTEFRFDQKYVWLQQYASQLHPLLKQYGNFSAAFEKQMQYQQDIHRRENEQQRQERLTQDPILQTLRKVIMTPDAQTELGGRIAQIEYPLRRRMWIELIQVGEDLYRQSSQEVQRPFAFSERPFMEQKKDRYAKFLTDILQEWVTEIEEEQDLQNEYVTSIRNRPFTLSSSFELPEHFEELPNFISSHEEEMLTRFVRLDGRRNSDRSLHVRQKQRKQEKLQQELDEYYQLPIGQRVLYQYLIDETDQDRLRAAHELADSITSLFQKKAQLEQARTVRLRKQAATL